MGWLARFHSPYDFVDFDGYNYDRPASPLLPTPPVPRPWEFRLNTLVWPSAASRPAWFHFICTTARLQQIHDAIGAGNGPSPLYFYDGRAGKTITAYMRMLPERPCNITTGTTDQKFWVCTLTDERFFWYLKRGSVGTPSSWTDLFSKLSTLIGTTIAVDTIPSEYGTPSADWKTYYRSPGAMLDAAAYRVGQRVVVGLDGTVRTVNWETAKAASDGYFATAPAPISGGRVSYPGIVSSVPESVNVVFADSSSSTPHVVNKTLAGLAITDYGAATGLAGYSDTVFGDPSYDGSNAAALASYATEAATDNYGWKLSDPDVAWPGIEPWVPTGWEERVEWTLTTRADGPFAETTVRRGPWQEFYAGAFEDAAAVTLGCGLKYDDDGAIEVDNVTLAGPGLGPISTCSLEVKVGCGLEIPVDTVVLNLTDVVFDGLYWDNDNCHLGVDFGCGLTLVGDKLTVDIDQLAGNVADTGLVVFTPPPPPPGPPPPPPPACPSLAVDKTCATQTTERLVNEVTVSFVGSSLKIEKTITEYTNCFNSADILVDRFPGTPTTYTQYLSICDAVTCCDETPLGVTVTTDHDVGTDTLTVAFDSTVTGGLGSPTYLWEFGDTDTSTAADPTHTFSAPGFYLVKLTVTTECAEEVVYVPILVGEYCVCDRCDPTLVEPSYMDFELENGVGRYAALNGVWRIYKAEGCFWAWYQNGWYVRVMPVVGILFRATFTNIFTGEVLLYTENPLFPVGTCCDAEGHMELTIGPATGAPDFLDDTITPEPDACQSCDPVTICPGTAHERELPGTLHAHVTAGTGGTGSFPIVYAAGAYTGSGVLCGTSLTVIATPCYDGVDESWSVELVGVNNTSGDPTSYSPFVWDTGAVYSVTPNTICVGATGIVTVTVTN